MWSKQMPSSFLSKAQCIEIILEQEILFYAKY